MNWRVLFILFFTAYTWYNIFRWVPELLTQPIFLLCMGVGLLCIIIGVIKLTSKS